MAKTISKSDIIDAIAAKTGFAKTSIKEVIDAAIDEITAQAKAGNKVNLAGFGAFKMRETPARTGRNPQTGEPIEIAASAHLTFKASKPTKKP